MDDDWRGAERDAAFFDIFVLPRKPRLCDGLSYENRMGEVASFKGLEISTKENLDGKRGRQHRFRRLLPIEE